MPAALLSVELAGRFPPTVRLACVRAARAAGFQPVAMLRTGRHHAMLVGPQNAALYVRWLGTRKPRVTWTKDPTIFSDLWRSRTLAAAAILAADPATPRAAIRLRPVAPLPP